MAFQSAGGYTNLPNGVFSPTIYSKKVQKQFRRTAVAEAITNSDYFGEIKNFGDSVKIIKEPEITISAYARGTQLTPQDLQDSEFYLIVDRANSFIFRIDDIEKQQSHVNWMDLASDRAAYDMAMVYDRDILGYMSGYEYNETTGLWAARTTAVGTKAESTADSDELLGIHKLTRASFVSGGSSSESVSVGVAGTYDVTPLAILNRMNRLLDVQNVPKDGRYVVVDPIFVEKLMDENSKLVNNDYNANQNAGGQLTNGKLIAQKIRGFEVYESNNLPVIGSGPGTIDNNGSSTDYGVIFAGQMTAAATAQQLEKTESYRDPYSFGDIVRGMHLYGRKILKPQALIRAWYNINA
jgi:hypothetical protein